MNAQGSDTLLALLEHPTLVSASNAFKDAPVREFRIPEGPGEGRSVESKWVYLFQREYATVVPALVNVRLFLLF